MTDPYKSQQDSDYSNPKPNPIWLFRMRIFGWTIIGLLVIRFFSGYIREDKDFWTVFIGSSVSYLILMAMFIQSSIAKKQAEISERQETIMDGQLNIMKDSFRLSRRAMMQNTQAINASVRQAEATEKALKQTDDMFYAANRAYIGIESIGLADKDGNTQQLPENGLFSIVCSVINKGRTPAFNFEHVFRLIFAPVPVSEKPFIDFLPFNENCIVPHILPDVPELIGGEPVFCPSHIYKELVIERTMLMVVSVKFNYNCLGIKDEPYIAHHIWDVDQGMFIFRRDWPANTTVGRISHRDAEP